MRLPHEQRSRAGGSADGSRCSGWQHGATHHKQRRRTAPLWRALGSACPASAAAAGVGPWSAEGCSGKNLCWGRIRWLRGWRAVGADLYGS